MSRRMKVIIAVLMAVVLLAAGTTATVMAQDESPTGENGLLARVAEILNIPEGELAHAFAQARQEMREEASDRALNRAVEEGVITEEEADEIRGWWGQKPEALDKGLFKHAWRFNLRSRLQTHLEDGFAGRFCPRPFCPAQ